MFLYCTAEQTWTPTYKQIHHYTISQQPELMNESWEDKKLTKYCTFKNTND